MTVTDAEKLALIKDYADNMSPVIRIALLFGPLDQARHEGYDEAMRNAQAELWKILNG
jgi:hypothetical protein